MKELNLQKFQNKLRNKFLKSGVKMIGPETIFFSKDTKIGKNVTIDPYVVIGKKVDIKNNVKIYSFSHLENTKIENSLLQMNINIPLRYLRVGRAFWIDRFLLKYLRFFLNDKNVKGRAYPYEATNRGSEIAKGKWLAFLDAYDFIVNTFCLFRLLEISIILMTSS